MLAACILLSWTLCRALRGKPVAAFAAVQTAALIGDGITTREAVKAGGYEADPVAKAFIGKYPTWGRMVPAGALQTILGMYLGEKMRESRHRWIRDIWWIPQTVGISGNATGIGFNINLLRKS